MSTGRHKAEQTAKRNSSEDQALLAELRAELDEGAADVASGRVISAEEHEREMGRFMAELQQESEHDDEARARP